MPSQKQISKRQDTIQADRRNELIRQFLVQAGEIHSRQITAQLVAIWHKLLRDVAPDVLEPILESVLAESKYFPVPADVRGKLFVVAQAAYAVEATRAWELAMGWMQRYFNPDMPGGHYGGAPVLDDRVQYAVSRAGGFSMLSDCQKEFLPIRMKEFIHAYNDYGILERQPSFVSNDRATELLNEGTKRMRAAGAIAESKGLPAVIASTEEEEKPK